MYTLFRTNYNFIETTNDYIFNEYFAYNLGNGSILLTNRHRAWIILTEQEYDLIKYKKIVSNTELFSILFNLGFILTDENLRKNAINYFKKYSYLTFPPKSLIVVPTKRCNLKCAYCYANASESETKSSTDMSEQLLYTTIDFFFSIPRTKNEFHMEFQGGEPLLRFDFILKGIDYAEKQAKKNKLKCDFTIITNLTLMTDVIAKEIKTRGNISLSSSLDGPEFIHDIFRCNKNKGSYKKVLYWIGRLKNKYNIDIGLLPTITKKTINYEKELVDEYINLDRKSIFILPVIQTGRLDASLYSEIG